MTTHLGWLGPAIVATGLAGGGYGAWYYAHAAPVAGDVIDTIALDPTTSLVIRAEAGGDRSFVELRDRGEVRWQALIPHYAGSSTRRGVAWGAGVVTIRVERGGEEELWVLGLADAIKVASLRLAPTREPIPLQHDEPLTLTDHAWTYELVSGQTWHDIVAINLTTGKALWEHELGPERILDASLDHGRLAVVSAAGRVVLDARTGQPYSPPP